MILGHVSANRDALIGITVIGRNGVSVSLQAIVDTGFSEYLTLPEWLAKQLGLLYIDSDEMVLADESVVPVDIYNGVVEWDGERREISIEVSPQSAILVGMRMMYGRKLCVHVIDGGEVRIEAE